LSAKKHRTILPLWIRGHADKGGPSYKWKKQINIQTYKLAGNAHTNLPLDFKARHDCIRFPKQHISLVIDGKKVTSRITMHVAHSIHYLSLNTYLIEKEEWSECIWNEIAWPSFKMAFNKIPSARQPTIKKCSSVSGDQIVDISKTELSRNYAASVKAKKRTGSIYCHVHDYRCNNQDE
jgi:hypothetical protein